MGPDRICRASLVADIFEEPECMLLQTLGGNWVSSTLK
jgi:hypothetical protein